LDILDVGLDLRSELLKVLDDGALDGLSERGVRVGDDTRLVSNGVENVLVKRGTEARRMHGISDMFALEQKRREREGLTWTPSSPRNWLPAWKGTWMTAPSLVSSRAVLFSMSAIPSK
jgi:hypothetical protein